MTLLYYIGVAAYWVAGIILVGAVLAFVVHTVRSAKQQAAQATESLDTSGPQAPREDHEPSQ